MNNTPKHQYNSRWTNEAQMEKHNSDPFKGKCPICDKTYFLCDNWDCEECVYNSECQHATMKEYCKCGLQTIFRQLQARVFELEEMEWEQMYERKVILNAMKEVRDAKSDIKDKSNNG